MMTCFKKSNNKTNIPYYHFANNLIYLVMNINDVNIGKFVDFIIINSLDFCLYLFKTDKGFTNCLAFFWRIMMASWKIRSTDSLKDIIKALIANCMGSCLLDQQRDLFLLLLHEYLQES